MNKKKRPPTPDHVDHGLHHQEQAGVDQHALRALGHLPEPLHLQPKVLELGLALHGRLQRRQRLQVAPVLVQIAAPAATLERRKPSKPLE